VLHLVPALFGPKGVVGGAERYALHLARSMSRHVPTTLVSFGRESEDTHIDDLHIRVIADAWHIKGQTTNPWSWAVLDEIGKADVVHCHQQHVLMSSISAATCRLSGRRVFATDLGGGGWDISAYVSTDRWFHGHLHISEYSRTVFGHSDKPWARVILGGVDTELFGPDATASRNGRPLFVGRILPHKGVRTLVNALPASMELDVVGPPNGTGTVEALKTLPNGGRVRFRHDVDDATLVDMYRRALCVVLPSVYRLDDGSVTKVPELLGQTLLEAMACGTPVICTRVASMPEIVEDGVTGFIVDPGDCDALGDRLRWLSAHPEEGSEMGQAGREAVLKRFQWPQVVERCLAAYTAVEVAA
jgi:glycosyltransferase involved in cell wall biosynthesis